MRVDFIHSFSVNDAMKHKSEEFKWSHWENEHIETMSFSRGLFYIDTVWKFVVWFELCSLRWRQNERDDVSNHQPHDCLFDRLLRRRSKKTGFIFYVSLKNLNAQPSLMTPIWRSQGPVVSHPDDLAILSISSGWLMDFAGCRPDDLRYCPLSSGWDN